MDYEEMNKAMDNALNNTLNKMRSVSNYPDGYQHQIEFDYSIVRMGNGRFIVARSRHIGSLDYDFLCECDSHWEATQIVKALNK